MRSAWHHRPGHQTRCFERRGPERSASIATRRSSRSLLEMRTADRRHTWGLVGAISFPMRKHAESASKVKRAHGARPTAPASAPAGRWEREEGSAGRGQASSSDQGAQSIAITSSNDYANARTSAARLAGLGRFAVGGPPEVRHQRSHEVLSKSESSSESSRRALNAYLQPVVGGLHSASSKAGAAKLGFPGRLPHRASIRRIMSTANRAGAKLSGAHPRSSGRRKVVGRGGSARQGGRGRLRQLITCDIGGNHRSTSR